MNLKRFILWSVALLVSLIQCKATDYAILSDKAQNFYERREWASVLAMCELMLEQQPTIAASYGRAITASICVNDTMAQVRLFAGSMQNQVPFDTVFDAVKREALLLGKTEIYEQFMLSVKSRYEWLERTVNANLLDYYAFRNDGNRMVEYSLIILERMPDNEKFMHLLAQGYMLQAVQNKAISTYEKILDNNPDDYDALLALGNYYAMQWDKDNAENVRKKAVVYLLRAYEISPTPYIESVMKRLQAK